ncbi:MAG: glycosyltransferase [Paucibacter sp.]|nr:glycosyltransferase [Roseateles sp.]
MSLPRVHIVSQLRSPFGGTEQRTMRLHTLLRASTAARMWNTHPRPELARAFCPEASALHARHLSFPMTGVFMFIGNFDWHVGPWLTLARPSRFVVLLNTPDTHLALPFLRRLHGFKPSVPIDVCYAARWMRDQVGLPGAVFDSPIDIELFRPGEPDAAEARPFTIGRLSRDTVFKHHPADAALYRRLAAAGFRVRLMGATVLAEQLGGVDGIELMAEGAEPAHEFLRSLDCFYYRTHPNWIEPHGRVVCEALATGLPLICVPPGGFTEFIEHGVSGFIGTGEDNVFETLIALRDDRERGRAVGAKARAGIEERFGDAAMQWQIDFLASPQPAQDVRALL